MTRLIGLICMCVSLWILGSVYFDINHNINNYVQVYSSFEQIVALTKITIVNLIVIVLCLLLFKRRYN